MDEVEEIKQRLDVAEVVGSYVQLKQSGRNLKAPCPFHQEKTASFMVSPEKGIWHCFGCGEGGDIYKFVMKMEGLDFRGALEKLAAQAGVELKNRGDGKTTEAKKRMVAAHQLAVRYFQQSLIKNPRALEYIIKKRKLTKQTVQDFQLGFAPESWEGLVGILRKQGFGDEEMVKAGLASTKNRGAFDMFRGRIMFTICDGQGQPVGFTGRVLDDSEPKYLNTPQTLLYDKSRAIYGLHLAREAIRTSNEAVIVEGNMDVVASHQAGVGQVVASSGTALTLDQLRALGRLTKNIKLAFDQDAAGLKATERVIDLAVKLGLQLRVIELSGAKDPDELIARSVDEWKKAIKDAAYVIDYLFDRFAREYDLSTATGKRQYTDRLAATLNRLSDPVERDHYVQRLAKAVGVSPEAVTQKLQQSEASTNTEEQRQMIKVKEKPAQAKATKPSGRQLSEEQFLALVLAFPGTASALDDLAASNFSTPERQAIFEDVKKAAESEKGTKGSLPEQSDYVKILTLRGEEQYDSLDPADRSFEAFELARRLQTLSSKQSKQELAHKLQAAESSGDSKLARQLLEQYQALIKD
jgi:DNA primase